MDKPDRRDTIDRRTAKVVATIAADIGRDKVRIDVIDQTIRSLEAKRRYATKPLPWPPWPLNKNDKQVGASISKALAKLEKQLSRRDDGLVLERAVYGEQPEFQRWKAQLKHWKTRFQTFGGKAESDNNSFTSDGLTTWPLGHRKRSSKFVGRHDAVKAAATIVDAHGLPLTATRKTLKRRASLFCRVAAILSAQPEEKIYYQCRAFLERRKTRKQDAK